MCAEFSLQPLKKSHDMYSSQKKNNRGTKSESAFMEKP